MKISSKTLSILKNFSSINPSIAVNPGSTLKTISRGKTVLARADVTEVFERPFAIYNLSQFIACLSMFSDPEIEFHDSHAVIGDGRNSFVYYYVDRSVILSPPDKDIQIPAIDAEFKLETSDLNNVLKAMSILELPEIAIVGDGNAVTLQAVDSRNDSSNAFKIEVGATDKTFRAIFKSDNLKMAPDNYEVVLSAKGISKFVGTEATYFITIETSSTF